MSEVLSLGASPKRVDPEVSEHGRKLEPWMAPGVTVTVLPWASWNPRFRRALQQRAMERAARGPVKRDALASETETLVTDREYDPEFIADAVIVDIEGLRNGSGNAVQYSRERGIAVLSDPTMVHFREWVVTQAQILAAGLEIETADAGNDSRSTSNGRRAGAGRSKKTSG